MLALIEEKPPVIEQKEKKRKEQILLFLLFLLLLFLLFFSLYVFISVAVTITGFCRHLFPMVAVQKLSKKTKNKKQREKEKEREKKKKTNKERKRKKQRKKKKERERKGYQTTRRTYTLKLIISKLIISNNFGHQLEKTCIYWLSGFLHAVI